MLQTTEGKLQRLKGKDRKTLVRSEAKPNLIVSVGGRVGGCGADVLFAPEEAFMG